MRNFILIVALVLSNNAALAQSNKMGNWLIYFGNQKINKNWNFHNEFQYRSYNRLEDPSQLLFRVGIGYNLSDNNNNILAGYGFIQSYLQNDSLKKYINENRIFQQFITKHNLKSLLITHRFRLEERFIEKDFKLRLRYFLSVNKPLNKPTLDKNAIYIASSNEIFIHMSDRLYDRNRFYVGLGYAFNKHIRAETGYMIQHTTNNTQQQFQLIFINNLPF